ncbi:hypothetical protein SPFM6_00242 [Salmonella phage SPFM6]|nr:hypothetical protein SPFM6_00242 [Salmonella phage SPFM6]
MTFSYSRLEFSRYLRRCCTNSLLVEVDARTVSLSVRLGTLTIRLKRPLVGSGMFAGLAIVEEDLAEALLLLGDRESPETANVEPQIRLRVRDDEYLTSHLLFWDCVMTDKFKFEMSEPRTVLRRAAYGSMI